MNYLEPYNFYFEFPLYTSIEITADSEKHFAALVSFEGKIDGYNPTLKEQTTFEVTIHRHYSKNQTKPTYFDNTTLAHLKCLRTEQVFEFYFITYQKNGTGNYFLHKIGQNPSIADLAE
jgi:hypothetical protein